MQEKQGIISDTMFRGPQEKWYSIWPASEISLGNPWLTSWASRVNSQILSPTIWDSSLVFMLLCKFSPKKTLKGQRNGQYNHDMVY